jgi:hypothetical protein
MRERHTQFFTTPCIGTKSFWVYQCEDIAGLHYRIVDYGLTCISNAVVEQPECFHQPVAVFCPFVRQNAEQRLVHCVSIGVVAQGHLRDFFHLLHRGSIEILVDCYCYNIVSEVVGTRDDPLTLADLDDDAI